MNRPKLMLVQKLVKDNHFEQAHEPDIDHQLTGAVPVMTWADWHLLQELHKARAGQSQNVEIEFNEPERKLGMPAAMAAPYGTAAGKVEVVRETINSEVRHRYDNVVIPVNGSTTDRLANEVRNAELTVAELQDQIKDWQAKCFRLEAANQQLSKSLQHYRNAYFADSAHTGTGTQPGSVTRGAGIHLGGAGQGGAK